MTTSDFVNDFRRLLLEEVFGLTEETTRDFDDELRRLSLEEGSILRLGKLEQHLRDWKRGEGALLKRSSRR